MATIREIQAEVAEWSKRNFGEQVSKITGQALGSLAPLLGLGEELGELIQARSKGDLPGEKDAIGDCCIYLLDYCGREKVDLQDIIEYAGRWGHPSPEGFLVAYGSLLHCTLKRHQGIRGFQDEDYYTMWRDTDLQKLVGMLGVSCRSKPLSVVLEEVWQEVKQRDWKKNPEGADKCVD